MPGLPRASLGLMLACVRSEATTVAAYLKSLPADRREAIAALRKVIRKNLPTGYVEAMRYGMISYEVPLAIEPRTYNGQPLNYAGLASQKNHMSVYLCGLYCLKGELQKFEKAWKGGRLDMGKACIRFRKLENLDLELIGRTIASVPVEDFVKASRR